MNRLDPSEQLSPCAAVRSRFVAADRLCYCMSKSKASTTDARNAVTDEGIVTQTEGVSVRDEGFANVQRAGGNLTTGGLQISDVSGSLSITTSDTEMIGAALDSIRDTTSAALSTVGTLASTRLTDGQDGKDKTLLILGVAGFAALAYLASRK